MIIALAMGLLTSCGGSARADQPDAAVVMAKLKKNIDAINDYRVDVSMSIKGPKISINDMAMRVYYKQPGKVHVEAKQGFALVPQGSFFGNPVEEVTKNTTPVYLKSEKKNGRPCHVIKLVSNQPGAAPDVVIWVDKERSVLVATETKGEFAFTTSWRYSKVDGKHYLPVQIDADLPSGAQGDSSSPTRATLKFSNYKVNKGIDDKVFEQQPDKKS